MAFPVAKSELLTWRLHDLSQGEIPVREINTIKQSKREVICLYLPRCWSTTKNNVFRRKWLRETTLVFVFCFFVLLVPQLFPLHCKIPASTQKRTAQGGPRSGISASWHVNLQALTERMTANDCRKDHTEQYNRTEQRSLRGIRNSSPSEMRIIKSNLEVQTPGKLLDCLG